MKKLIDQIKPYISVVLPVYNEEENLIPLFDRLILELSKLNLPYEIIAVDDGSKDNSAKVLNQIAIKSSELRVIEFKTNFGQTAALSAGIEHARGEVIVSMDSDLENDPSDIKHLLDKLNEGYDVISGWRHNRWKGSLFTRKIPSVIANWLISFLTGVHLHDYGCTLKAYKADVIKGVKLYGEMHRFIPAYASWQGGKVTEIKVKHEPRKFGKSNYGAGRILRVLLDLVVVIFMNRYMNRPMHFFGAWGFWMLVLGVLGGAFLVILRILGMSAPVESFPILVALLILVGVQLILFGVIAEVLMRTYYESQNKRPYIIKEE
jgi:glycosyltransferase involved in cell wall biosynthesis